MSVPELLRFPNPVNEVSARLVAAGVVLMTIAVLAGQHWVLVPLAYGFVARLAAGPRFSPLGLLVTKVITPRLPVEPKLVPGPPKRFAQGIGAALSVSALVSWAVFDNTTVALVLVAAITIAATLESVFAYCLGCKAFALLMRVGVIPPEVCEACNDLSLRSRVAAVIAALRRRLWLRLSALRDPRGMAGQLPEVRRPRIDVGRDRSSR